jgi:hypothetical protein
VTQEVKDESTDESNSYFHPWMKVTLITDERMDESVKLLAKKQRSE